MPLFDIPIGHMLQNTGSRRTAEPTNADTKTPFATAAFLLAKNLPKRHVGQIKPFCVFLFSLLRTIRSSRFTFVLGIKRSTTLSKTSIIVPNGQAQPQNTFPNKNIGTRKRKSATNVKIRSGPYTFPVNRACKPPKGQINHAPGPT